MNLENQVVSLELAKKLKELEVPQESYFWWDTRHINLFTKENGRPFYSKDTVSAYTVAELGEFLPDTVNGKLNEEIFGANGKTHNVQFDFWTEPTGHNYGVVRKYRCAVGSKQFVENTESNARAKMLMYLLENKLITL